MKTKILQIIFLLVFQSIAIATERGTEQSDAKRFNIQFQPVPVVIGIINANLDIKLTDNFVAGPAFMYWNLNLLDISIKASSIGAQGRYYIDEAFRDSSWFVGGSLAYVKAEASITSLNVKYTGSSSNTTFSAGGGYTWFWTTFNQTLGAHLTAASGSKVELKDSAGNKYKDDAPVNSNLGIEYSLGWMF